MPEQKHTPGPWEAENLSALWVTGPDRDAPVICDLLPRDADSYTEEDEANARLIAAAPELLEALDILIASIDVPERGCSCHISPPCSDCVEYSHVREALEQARAVIAKAEGREASNG